MMFKDIFAFNDLLDKIERCLNIYENKNIAHTRYKVLLANGDYIEIDYNYNCLAHLLGINIDYLRSTSFYIGNTFDVLEEIINNPDSLYQRMKNGYIDPYNTFSKFIDQKLDNFENITTINMFNMEFVAKYDSSKCYGTNYDKLDGDYYLAFKDPNNSDKISILGIRKNGNMYYPITNLQFDESSLEYTEFLSRLLVNQTITAISKINRNSIVDFSNIDRKSFYYNNTEKYKKFKLLSRYAENYNCSVDVTQECLFYIDKITNLYDEKKQIWEILNKISIAMQNNIPIDIFKLENEYSYINDSITNLIATYNDSILTGGSSLNNNTSVSYKDLIEKIKILENRVMTLEDLNQKLDEQNQILTGQVSDLSNENMVFRDREQKIRKILE